MTETQRKALALVNEVRDDNGLPTYSLVIDRSVPLHEALCRAIERDEAFRQEVSDAVVEHLRMTDENCSSLWRGVARDNLARFIIAKPDPLVEALGELADRNLEARQAADTLRAAIEKRGGKIVWGEGA